MLLHANLKIGYTLMAFLALCQRAHMHLLMFLLLQQLQQQNASTQRGPWAPACLGPGPKTSVWKHFAAEAAEVAKT